MKYWEFGKGVWGLQGGEVGGGREFIKYIKA